MEPSAQDIAAVSQMLGEAPQPQPTPAPTPQVVPDPQPTAPQPQAPQQQPTQPVSQPAPTQQPQDPFSTLFQPTEQPAPVEQPAPQAPQQAPQEPVAPVAPVEQPAPQPQEQYQSFEEYMDSVTQGIGEEPTVPDPNKIDPNDEAGIKNFFDDLVNTAVAKAEQKTQRNQAIQNSERSLWDSAFDKYGSLRENKQLRDMVHSIRMGEFQRGVAITPTQAADRLLNALQSQYQKGVADNAVVTTIQDVQPNGGGSAPIQTTTDMDNVYTRIQTGGETALADYLDGQIKAGNI